MCAGFVLTSCPVRFGRGAVPAPDRFPKEVAQQLGSNNSSGPVWTAQIVQTDNAEEFISGFRYGCKDGFGASIPRS